MNVYETAEILAAARRLTGIAKLPVECPWPEHWRSLENYFPEEQKHYEIRDSDGAVVLSLYRIWVKGHAALRPRWRWVALLGSWDKADYQTDYCDTMLAALNEGILALEEVRAKNAKV